jgi:hypothetical protein
VTFGTDSFFIQAGTAEFKLAERSEYTALPYLDLTDPEEISHAPAVTI